MKLCSNRTINLNTQAYIKPYNFKKNVGQKYLPKNKYFFVSFNNDRGLSLAQMIKQRIMLTEILEIKFIRYMRSHNTGNICGENLHI